MAHLWVLLSEREAKSRLCRQKALAPVRAGSFFWAQLGPDNSFVQPTNVQLGPFALDRWIGECLRLACEVKDSCKNMTMRGARGSPIAKPFAAKPSLGVSVSFFLRLHHWLLFFQGTPKKAPKNIHFEGFGSWQQKARTGRPKSLGASLCLTCEFWMAASKRCPCAAGSRCFPPEVLPPGHRDGVLLAGPIR